MTTPYKQALNDLNGYLWSGEEVEWEECLNVLVNHKDAICRALLIADAVESGKVHLCEKLIGGGEYDGATCYDYYAKLPDEKLKKIGAGE